VLPSIVLTRKEYEKALTGYRFAAFPELWTIPEGGLIVCDDIRMIYREHKGQKHG